MSFKEVKMTKIKSGFVFHLHHDTLFEFCPDYNERVAYIKRYKPKGDQELRLKLFQLIPEEELPKPLAEAERAYSEAKRACSEADQTLSEARLAYYKAERAYCDAEQALSKTSQACQPEIQTLHSKLCPNCPWNGRTIFSITCKEAKQMDKPIEELIEALYKDLKESYPSLTLDWLRQEAESQLAGNPPRGGPSMFLNRYLKKLGKL